MQGMVGALWSADRRAAFSPKQGASCAGGDASRATNSLAKIEEFPPSRRIARSVQPSKAGIASLMSMAAAVFFAPQQAEGAQVIATITGTVSQGTDTSGVFGAAGGKLDGDSFTLVYSVDDTKGTGTVIECRLGSSSCPPPPPVGSRIESTTTSNPMTAVLTINGHSLSYGTPPALNPLSEAERTLENGSTVSFSISQEFAGYNPGNGQVQMKISSLGTSKPPFTTDYNWESALTSKGPYDYPIISNGQFGIFRYNATTGQTYQQATGALVPAGITISGPIQPLATPHIYFVDPKTGRFSDITNSTVPVPVVVGELIQLVAIPAATPATPNAWTVTGRTVGGYTPTETSFQTGRKIQTDFGPNSSTQFYWFTQDPSAEVTYAYTRSSGTTKIKANFDVSGPPIPDVNFHEKTVGISCAGGYPFCDFFYDTVNGETFLAIGFGNSSPGSPNLGMKVSIPEPKAPPNPPSGTFEWVQLVLSDIQSTSTTSGVKLVCSYSPGLDLQYPYRPGPTANDSPSRPVAPNYASVGREFSAQMFLMWKSESPETIVVPLGSVIWGFKETSSITGIPPYGWATPTVMSHPGTFIGNLPEPPDYPVWDALAKATFSCK